MGFAPFEIQRLIMGDGGNNPPLLERRYSRFPRTGRMRVLLASIVVLAAIVFGLNLIESSRIPANNDMGHGETKDGSVDTGGSKPSTPLQQQTLSTSSPTQSPSRATTSDTAAPSPMLRPGSTITPPMDISAPGAPSPVEADPTPQQPDVGQSTLEPTPSQPGNVQNVVPDFTYPEALAPVMNNSSQAFVERWCDLDGTDWYPKGENMWKLRAPAFLIPGAKYSGIFAITKLLEEHPQIRPPSKGPETRFFFEPDFLRYVKSNEKTTVMQARERLLATNYPATEFRKSQGSISYDASSGYLFRSTVLPRRLLCVLPWIKVVAVLRDPIERIHVHYRSMKFNYSLPHQLEDWINHDMDLMRHAGLISNTTNQNAKTSMSDEDVAWYEYQHKAKEGPVGRSLYDIQLRQWFQALRAIGRNPRDSVLIVKTEELVENPAREFNRILKFLDLSQFTPSSFDVVSTLAAERSSSNEMSQKTRTMLQEFFKPYQTRLEKLLQKFKVPYGSSKANKGNKDDKKR